MVFYWDYDNRITVNCTGYPRARHSVQASRFEYVITKRKEGVALLKTPGRPTHDSARYYSIAEAVGPTVLH